MLDDPQLLLFALLLLATGAFAGIIAGLLGVGGGIVIVPVLYAALGHFGVDDAVRMQVALGTSLATIVITAWSSTSAHWKRGTVDVGFLRGYGPWVVLGVLLGAALAAHLRGTVLTAFFAAVALVIAAQIAFGRPSGHWGDALPTGGLRALFGTLIGGVSALMGIGGGSLTVPLMTLYGTPVHRAVGTAAATGFIIGIPGVIGFMIGGWGAEGLPPGSLGFISLPGLLAIAPTSMLCAPLGAKLAYRLNTTILRRVFAAFLAIMALRMFWSLLG